MLYISSFACESLSYRNNNAVHLYKERKKWQGLQYGATQCNICEILLYFYDKGDTLHDSII
jgi:hypothetical protein